MAVSILMSVFNCESTIELTLLSILNQTYKDFELVVVNDGSTDKTIEILKKYAIKEQRIKLINKNNTGLIDSLNTGLLNCTHEFVVRHDAEDLSHKKRLEILVDYANAHPEISCFSTKMLLINNKYKPIGLFPLKTVGDINSSIDNNEFIVSHASALYKKSDILSAGGYPNALYCEDFALWYNMRKAKMKFFYIDIPLYACMRSNSGITYTNLEQQLHNCSLICGQKYNIKKIVEKKRIKEKVLYNIDTNYNVWNFYGLYFYLVKIFVQISLIINRRFIKGYSPYIKN